MKLDHIGIAVENLEEALRIYSNTLGLNCIKLVELTDKGMKIAIIDSHNLEIELIQPLRDETPVGRFIKKRGSGIHHICFSVSEFDATIKYLEAKGLNLASPPQLGAKGKRVAFFHPKSTMGVLMEICEGEGREMNLEQAIKGRRSIRRFKPNPVPRKLIEEILDLAMWAPSGMNQQNWYFVVIQGEKLKRLINVSKRAFDEYTEPNLSKVFSDKPQIIQATKNFFYTLGNAPVVLLAYRISTVEGELTDIQSVAAAIQNLLLVAHAKGIGGCWMTGPTHLEREINRLVGVEGMKLQAIIPIGYPDMHPPVPKRKSGKVKWIGFD